MTLEELARLEAELARYEIPFPSAPADFVINDLVAALREVIAERDTLRIEAEEWKDRAIDYFDLSRARDTLEAALREVIAERDKFKAWANDHALERDAYARSYNEACQEREALKLRVAELEQQLRVRAGKRNCEQCGKEYTIMAGSQRFCTARCRSYAASARRRGEVTP